MAEKQPFLWARQDSNLRPRDYEFAKCNTDENPAIAGGFGISAIPTIILFKSGTVADIVVGAIPKETLKARIKKVFHLL